MSLTRLRISATYLKTSQDPRGYTSHLNRHSWNKSNRNGTPTQQMKDSYQKKYHKFGVLIVVIKRISACTLQASFFFKHRLELIKGNNFSLILTKIFF